MPSEKIIHDANALLVFSVGPVLCCAPTLTVEAVIMPPLIHKVPGSDHNHPGVFRHTHGMVSVVDLRQRFGVEEAALQQPGRVIVAEIAGGHAGFLVDTIQDVMLWPEQGWGALPALVPRNVFKRTLLLKNQIHLYTDFEDLFRIRESGYLREHIAMLDSKQRRKTEKDLLPIAITLPEKVANETRHTNKTESVPLVTIDKTKTGTSPAPARPVAEIHKPKKSVADVLNKKREEKIGPEQITTNKLTTDKKAGSKIAENNKTVVVDSYSIRGAIETVDNTFYSQAVNSSLQQIDPPESASGRVFILGLMILLLAAIVLLVTSFSDTEKVAIMPEVAAVIEQPLADADLENNLNLNDAYQADISQDAEGIVITIDEVVEEAPISEAVPVHHSEPDSTEEVKAGFIPTPVPAPVIENKNIVHIVVPGDTLWDIANRYVRDPWRYPELAKLSNIKNPHRIYPGNKVKIIIRKTNKPAQQ